MITFKQFIFEDPVAAITPTEAAKYIVENCQDFLKETKFHISHNASYAAISSPLLYRGLSGFPRNTGYALSGERSRTPIDSSKALTDTLDHYFKERFNFEYRRKGVFCSGSLGFSSNYGNVFAIFPTDGYDSIWSREIKDAYMALDYRKNGEIPNFARRICLDMKEDNPFENESLREDDQWEQWYQILWMWLNEKHPYTDGDLLGGMTQKVKSEIMLCCKEYIAIPVDNSYTHEFVEEMLELLE